MRRLQLLFYSRFRGCRFLKLTYILRQRMLHILHRVAQIPDLIPMFNIRQRHLEVTFCHLISGRSQLFQRLGSPLDRIPAHQPHDHHRQKHEERQKRPHAISDHIQGQRRCEQHQRPPCMVYRCEEHIARTPVKIRAFVVVFICYFENLTGLPFQNALGHRHQDRIL